MRNQTRHMAICRTRRRTPDGEGVNWTIVDQEGLLALDMSKRDDRLELERFIRDNPELAAVVDPWTDAVFEGPDE